MTIPSSGRHSARSLWTITCTSRMPRSNASRPKCRTGNTANISRCFDPFTARSREGPGALTPSRLEAGSDRRRADPGQNWCMLALLYCSASGINTRSFPMKRLSLIAIAAALFMALPTPAVLAQSTQDTGATPPPPPPPPAAAPAPAPPPAAAAPTTTASQTTTTTTEKPATEKPTTTTEKETGTKKKKSGKSTSRQQEIDHSIQSGTVPSRYRSQVPKEYQKYIPFEK